MKNKLLIVLGELGCGGAERFVITLLRDERLYRSYDVTLLLLNGGLLLPEITGLPISIVDLKRKRVRESFFSILNELKRIKPDIVFGAIGHLNLTISILRYMFRLKFRLVVRETSIASRRNSNAQSAWMLHYLYRVFYKKIDAIIVQSKEMERDLIDGYSVLTERLHHIPNPLNSKIEEYLATSWNIYEKNTSNIMGRYIVVVGRLEMVKGVDRVLRAMPYVNQKISLLVIGKGSQLHALQTLTEQLKLTGRVYFLGHQDNPYNYIRDAIALISPSHYEGFPNVAIEANALGIPVIGFKGAGGLDDIIHDKQCGILINDEGDLPTAINSYLDKYVGSETLSAITKNTFQTHKILSKYLSVIGKVVN